MKTTGFDYIDLSISNLERRRRFYADIFGFQITGSPVNYAFEYWLDVRSNG